MSRPLPSRSAGPTATPSWRAPPRTSVVDVVRADPLRRQLDQYPAGPDDRVGAWSILVGHTTCSDPLWLAARELATERGTGFSFHMSPAMLDPEGFIAEFGQRPALQVQ